MYTQLCFSRKISTSWEYSQLVRGRAGNFDNIPSWAGGRAGNFAKIPSSAPRSGNIPSSTPHQLGIFPARTPTSVKKKLCAHSIYHMNFNIFHTNFDGFIYIYIYIYMILWILQINSPENLKNFNVCIVYFNDYLRFSHTNFDVFIYYFVSCATKFSRNPKKFNVCIVYFNDC